MSLEPWRQAWEAVRARRRAHRPLVTAAFALSQDGYLTGERGQPTALSGPEALRLTHALRAAHDAILVGRGTQQADDPRLTTRFGCGATGLRVLLDSSLQLSPAARLVTSEERPVLVFTSPDAPAAREFALRSAQVEVERLPVQARGLSLPAALGRLARRGVTTVMVEGGADVLESFFLEGLVDFLCVTTAPRRLAGPRALGLGPAAAAALAAWRPATRVLVGADVVTAGAVERAYVEAVG
jgi:riboflavin-specific deaminase-like protein